VEVVTTIVELRRRLDRARAGGAVVGLVPTMGSLHAGHVSLLDRAVDDCDFTAATVFVNPLQFAPTEDFAAYPRDLDTDLKIIESAGADVVFAPALDEMYPGPGPVLTRVAVAELSDTLDGASRPGHFDGVATVVAKLFNAAGPARAYFGEKDYQQLQIVRRMVADLSFPVEVVGCPIVRDPDGLALSSRNAYLSPEERVAAPVLHRALLAGAAAIERDGQRDPAAVRGLMTDIVAAEPHAALDYAEVVDPRTLRRIGTLDGDVRLLVAARFGRARLIDNMGARVADPRP
jgi:pantoate--beta-alanine ligase